MNPSGLDVAYIARLARIHLTPEETAQFQAQLGTVLTYVDQISRPDTDGIEPTAHSIPMENILRPDEPRPGLDPADTLRNAPRTANSLFVVPKVVG